MGLFDGVDTSVDEDEDFFADDEPVSAAELESAVEVDAGAGGLSPAGVDPALGSEDAQPLTVRFPFLGKRLREMDASTRRDAMVWLREWVDWFVVTHQVEKKLFPSCWFLHSEVVEFVWAAANAEMQAWAQGEPSFAPMASWHSYIPGLLARLETGSQIDCSTAGQHEGDYPVYGSPFHPRAVAVDEGAWAQFLAGEDEEISSLSPGSWRVVLSDKVSGERLMVSESVEVPYPRPYVGAVGRPYVRVDGEGVPGAFVRMVVDAPGMVSAWEKFVPESGEWVVSERSVVEHDPLDFVSDSEE